MGCANSSNPGKDLLISPDRNNKVNQILSKGYNGTEKIQNSINETLNDVNNLDFKKAQEDLQQIGEGLKEAVSDGVNDLMEKAGVPTSNGSTAFSPSSPPGEEVREPSNTPIPDTSLPNDEDETEETNSTEDGDSAPSRETELEDSASTKTVQAAS